MSDQLPLVSVIAVCYNHERFVEDTLESIVAQTYPNTELLIFDDCSSDHSVKTIKNWIKENKVKCQFTAHQVNQGLCKTLNEALDLCHGKYIQLIACDDLIFPDKISDQVQILESKSEDYCLVYSDVKIIDDNGKEKEKSFYQRSEKQSLPEGIVYLDQAKSQFIKGISCLIKRKNLIAVGKYDEDLTFEDVDIFLRLAKDYKFTYQGQSTAYWREHHDNLTNKIYFNPKHLETRLKAYKKHLFKRPDIDSILIPKVLFIITFLYKNQYFISFHGEFKSKIKKEMTILYWCIKTRIPYRVFLLIQELAKSSTRIKSIFSMPKDELPPSPNNRW
jgi:glycosyltransferase involved in cell wall biosynthesis